MEKIIMICEKELKEEITCSYICHGMEIYNNCPHARPHYKNKECTELCWKWVCIEHPSVKFLLH